MRILVCGGRTYNRRDKVFETLDALIKSFLDGRATIIEGGAAGADDLAGQYADLRGHEHIEEHITSEDWKLYGNAAGNARNQRMLDLWKPELVVAFPGGTGTADMVRRARIAGVMIMEIA